jgi:hypothetical protein
MINLRAIRVVSLFLLCFAVSGSFAADAVPDSMVFKADLAATWKAVVLLFSDKGWIVTQQDKDIGLIGTDWHLLQATTMFTKGWRARGNILLKKIDDNSTELTPKFVFEFKYPAPSPSQELAWLTASEDNKYTPELKTKLYEGVQAQLESK